MAQPEAMESRNRNDSAETGHRAFERTGPAGVDDDRVAMLDEGMGESEAEASRRAGDDGDRPAAALVRFLS